MAIASDALVRDKLFIGGEWVEPAGDGTIEVINPTTEEVMGAIPEGTAEDADRAVAAARAAFDALVADAGGERAALLRRIGASSPSAARRSRALITTELGMPLGLSQHDPGRAADA